MVRKVQICVTLFMNDPLSPGSAYRLYQNALNGVRMNRRQYRMFDRNFDRLFKLLQLS